jgi:trk system potassium uptake protein TrkH
LANRRREKIRTGNGLQKITRPAGKPTMDDPLGRWVANWAFPIYMGLILLGFILIRADGFTTGTRSGVRALFYAINAATLTGFELNPGVGSLASFGQVVVLVLMIVGILFTTVVGGLAVKRIVKSRFSDDQVIYAAVIALAVALVLGTPALVTDWGSAEGWFRGSFLAASAYGNCGLYIGGLPDRMSLITYTVLLPLTILGGVGIPVVMEIAAAVARRGGISKHSRDVLTSSAWLYVAGFAVLWGLNLVSARSAPTGESEIQAATASSVLSIESRTGGLPIVPVHELSQSAQWVLIVLMMIGASPGGTGGGLKCTTVLELWRGTRRLIAGQPAGRGFGVAVLWLGIYAGIVVGGAMLLSFISPTAAVDGTLMNAVSGASNVGFTLEPVRDAKNVMYAHCAIMLLGRMVPAMILWWVADAMSEVETAVG